MNRVLLIGCCLLSLIGSLPGALPAPQTSFYRVTHCPAFSHPILWSGSVVPAEAESLLLWNTLEVWRTQGTPKDSDAMAHCFCLTAPDENACLDKVKKYTDVIEKTQKALDDAKKLAEEAKKLKGIKKL